MLYSSATHIYNVKADNTRIGNFKMTFKKTGSKVNQVFDGTMANNSRVDNTDQPGIITRRRLINSLEDEGYLLSYTNIANGIFPRQSLLLRLKKNNIAKLYRGTGWNWGTLKKSNILVHGDASIELADALITKENAKNYRYRIILNDRQELFGWTIPHSFRKTADGTSTYAYFGEIKYQPNQIIQIEIYNVKNYNDRDALIIDWRNTKKFKCWVNMQLRDKSGKYEMLSASLGEDKKNAKSKWNFIETDTLSNVQFRLGDSLIRIQFQSQNLETPYNYQVILRRTVNNKTEIINLGECNDHFELYKEFWDKPGYYEISFTPKLLEYSKSKAFIKYNTWTYHFKVLPPINVGWSFNMRELTIIIALICIIIGAIFSIFIFKIRKQNAVKLMEQQQQKEIAKEQLQAIRSQLNPHFMFNALAAIQSLMNRNNIDAANLYLGKFARITRNVLVSKEMVTLKEEKTLLDDFLQMEQLRFGFQYSINLEDDLEVSNIEIPSMLLQTFVENAVKHGIGNLKGNGVITIIFKKKQKDLILILNDNGKGFDSSQEYSGFGLRLSKNRLSLLNHIYKESPIDLTIIFNHGTTITITLNQWL